MPPAKSQTTRLLCATALLAGDQFREQVLSHFEHESRGASPELGVNMRLVAMVCHYVRTRARLFDLYLSLALVAGVTASAVDLVLGISVLLLTATAIHLKATHEWVHLASWFREEHFNETKAEEFFTLQLEPEVLEALPREDQNLIVYSGFTPFVGAGINLGGWSFVVDIFKFDDTIENPSSPIPFTVKELYTAVGSRISDSHLDGLVIKDYYFANGRGIRSNREVLPDIYSHPVQCLNHQSAQEYLSKNDTHIRHYAWIRIHDWDQELVTSFFLRFSIRGRNLFVEINRFLLTPLSEKYRKIDTMTPLRTLDRVELLTTSALVGPVRALFTPFLLFGRLTKAAEKHLGGRERAHFRNIDRNPLFDYGAGQGHRQALSSSQYEHFFQKSDAAFCIKALESIILDRTISFLDEHHVDTSGLRERQNMILNSGIIVHGGDVTAESLAVGSGARATKIHRPQSKAKGEAK